MATYKNNQTIGQKLREFKSINKSIRINGAIRASELRVISDSGEQLGVMSLDEALKAATDAELDLVEISPDANPPVAKIIDWGKFQYQKMKDQQKNRQKSKANDLKQIRMGLKIGENDLNIKLKKITKFLASGHKVKIMIVFKGREMAHKNLGFKMMDSVIEKLDEDAVVEQQPQMAGRNLSITVRRK